MDKVVNIAKAGGVGGHIPEDTRIIISGEPPNLTTGGNWEEQYRGFYDSQADMLFDALVKSLPGGTLTRLTVRLLDKHASLLKIAL